MNPIKKTARRKAAAKKIIHRRMLYAAGLGLVPIPIVDAAGILSTQVLMIKDIAKIYRIPFKGQVAKSLIGSLVGSLGTGGIIKAIPVLGTVVGGVAMSLTGIAATYAIGKIFTLHFEQGGTLLDFDPVQSRKYFEQAYREGEIRAAALKDANKGRIEKLFQSKTNGAVVKVANGKQPSTEILAEQKAYQAALKKAKRRKALKAKKRRKARFRKYIGRILIYSVLLVGAIIFFRKYIVPRLYSDKDALESNEIDLFLKENEAKPYHLEPAEHIDSLTQVQIASFSPVSTEGVISQFLQKPEASFPKRYSLNAVRFVGTSEKISSGAQEQLAHIALLMKKYPELLVNIYGHTGSKGPVFNRQRIGRDRARVLTEVFLEQGIPSYRITGNYIEKQQDTGDGYWGAEIVLHVATIESVVEVAPPTMSVEKNIINSISDRIKKPEITETPIVEEEPEVTEAPLVENEPEAKREIKETPAAKKPASIDSTVFQTEIDTQQKEAPLKPNTQTKEDTIEEEKIPIIPPEAQKVEETPPPVEAPKPAKKVVTVEGVMQQYIESTNPKYPKVFPLNKVSFKGETTEVNAAGNAQLVKIAAFMKKHPQMQVKINGHASGIATVNTQEEKNQFLLKWQGIGEKRARAIKKIFRDQGIANKRIKTGFRLQNQGADTESWNADLVIERN